MIDSKEDWHAKLEPDYMNFDAHQYSIKSHYSRDGEVYLASTQKITEREVNTILEDENIVLVSICPSEEKRQYLLRTIDLTKPATQQPIEEWINSIKDTLRPSNETYGTVEGLYEQINSFNGIDNVFYLIQTGTASISILKAVCDKTTVYI